MLTRQINVSGMLFARKCLETWKPIKMTRKHIVLGRNTREAQAARDKWLSEHHNIEVLQEHPPRQEPATWLVRIGGQNIPRISIEVEYRLRDAS